MADYVGGSAMRLKDDRSIGKYILFTIITFGIYSIYYFSVISTDINYIASRYDGKNTMHYCLVCFLLGPITFGIFMLVWFHQLSNRIGAELQRRGINYQFSASAFWLWYVVGSLIIVGPFVYVHKLSTAMNSLAQSYNANGQ